MVFSSLEFVFWFLPVFLVIYYLVPGKGKNLWLFVGSLGFYFYEVRDTPFYFILLVLSILVNYKIGTLIGRRRFQRFRKRWLVDVYRKTVPCERSMIGFPVFYFAVKVCK